MLPLSPRALLPAKSLSPPFFRDRRPLRSATLPGQSSVEAVRRGVRASHGCGDVPDLSEWRDVNRKLDENHVGVGTEDAARHQQHRPLSCCCKWGGEEGRRKGRGELGVGRRKGGGGRREGVERAQKVAYMSVGGKSTDSQMKRARRGFGGSHRRGGGSRGRVGWRVSGGGRGGRAGASRRRLYHYVHLLGRRSTETQKRPTRRKRDLLDANEAYQTQKRPL